MSKALGRWLGRVFRTRSEPAGGTPALETVPPASESAEEARQKMNAYAAWGIAEGAITQEEAADLLRQFDAEQREKERG